MISASELVSGDFMTALLARMAAGGAARARLYAGARPASGAAHAQDLVGLVLFADVAGEVVAGELVIAPGPVSVALSPAAPVWARVTNGDEVFLFDCDCRLSGVADTGQELVLSGTALQAGVALQILSGTLSALPA